MIAAASAFSAIAPVGVFKSSFWASDSAVFHVALCCALATFTISPSYSLLPNVFRESYWETNLTSLI